MSIPDRSDEWKPPDAPDFVRFYMGKLICKGRVMILIMIPLKKPAAL